LSERNLTSEYNIKQASDRVKIIAKLLQYSKGEGKGKSEHLYSAVYGNKPL